MASEEYLRKLQDPRWQKKRLKIFERDGWQCQICHAMNDTLHVHHKQYMKNTEPWEYPDDYLVTLCHICHEKQIPGVTTCGGLGFCNVIFDERNGNTGDNADLYRFIVEFPCQQAKLHCLGYSEDYCRQFVLEIIGNIELDEFLHAMQQIYKQRGLCESENGRSGKVV